MVGAMLFGGLGTVIGLTAGAATSTERWEPASTNPAAPEQPRPARGQDPRGGGHRRGRWSVSAISATTSSGPAKDIETAMRAAGFDDPTDCWFFCSSATSIVHPFSRTGWGETGFPWLLELRYRWSRTLGLGLLTGKANIGTTLGYNSNQGGNYLFVDYGVRTWAVAPDVGLGPLRVQTGPALFRASSRRSDATAFSSAAGSRVESKLGWLAGLGLSIRSVGPVRLEGRVQYRVVGRATVGPYQLEERPWLSQPAAAPFPATAVSFSHWFAGAGLGLQF